MQKNITILSSTKSCFSKVDTVFKIKKQQGLRAKPLLEQTLDEDTYDGRSDQIRIDKCVMFNCIRR